VKKILFDEGVPLPLRQALVDFEVHTVQELGLAGCEDSEVIRRAEKDGFDLLITNDKNIRHQQSTEAFGLLLYELPIMNWPQLRERVDEVVREIKALLPDRGDIDEMAVDE